MPESMPANAIIDEYIKDIDSELRSAPDSVREEFVTAIKVHISEVRSSQNGDDEGEIRMMLQRIGDPKELAAEVLETSESSTITRTASVTLRVVLAVLVIAVLVAGLALRATYQPQIGSMISFVRVLDSNGNVVNAIANGKTVGSSATQVWLEPKGTYTVEVNAVLRNGGDLGVTLESIQNPNGPIPKSPFKVYFGGGGNHFWGSLGGFHKVSMPGHGTVSIGLRYSERCTPGSNGTFVQFLPITYSFLGVRHTTLVPIQPFRLRARQAC
ncbi:MAG: HAAS signaling domain-containing protein [Lacisediminihabitans sp.]